MGGFVSSFWNKLTGVKDTRIVMVGLDAAGKTTVLYKLKMGEVVSTMPTIGFNVEAIEYKNVSMTMWDVGGQDRIRPLWRHYYQNTQAVIFVVDSADVDRLDDRFDEPGPGAPAGGSAKEELARCLAHDELKDSVLLVLANKQDLPGALKTAEVAERLGLNKLRNRQWRIQGCAATKGEGLFEGLDWLADTLKKMPRA